jgi:hypothetical protein
VEADQLAGTQRLDDVRDLAAEARADVSYVGVAVCERLVEHAGGYRRVEVAGAVE